MAEQLNTAGTATATAEAAPAPSAGTVTAPTPTQQKPDTQPAPAPQPKAAETPKAEKPKETAKTAQPAAPETYELQEPDGVQLQPSTRMVFEEFARKLDLGNEAAQEFYAELAPALQEKQAEMLKTTVDGWQESLRTHKELGGKNLQVTKALGVKALDAYGNPELKALLEQLPIHNHPAVAGFLKWVGQRLTADRHVTPDSRGAPRPESVSPNDPNRLAAVLYGQKS